MTLLSYILHRRSNEGFLDSLAPACAADHVLLSNRIAGARKRPPGGSGDAEQDAMSSFLGGD